MPIPKVDPHSQAIIYYPTPEEVATKEREKRMEEKERRVDELIAKLEAQVEGGK